MKLLAFIPARLESHRFPKKIIKNIFGLPMIEHVIRRIKYSNIFDEIVVVTNNLRIKKMIKHKDIKVVLSKEKHSNGTSRVSEISKNFNYNLGVILFADEPFLKSKKLKIIIKKLKKIKNFEVINVVTKLKKNDLDSKEIVKCETNKKGIIENYFRNKKKIKKGNKLFKSSGILIFKKKILDSYKILKKTNEENKFKIEQFRFLKNNLKLKSIFVDNIYPSINTKKEFNEIIKLIKSKKSELKLIEKLKYL